MGCLNYGEVRIKFYGRSVTEYCICHPLYYEGEKSETNRHSPKKVIEQNRIYHINMGIQYRMSIEFLSQ